MIEEKTGGIVMLEFDLKEQFKTATDALVDLENKIKSLTNALPDPIFIIDEQGFYLEVLGGEEKSLYHLLLPTSFFNLIFTVKS